MQWFFDFILEYKIYFIIALVAMLLLIKPVRRNLKYLSMNLWGVLLYFAAWVICSAAGISLAMNIYAAGICAILGIPGLALVVFLNIFK